MMSPTLFEREYENQVLAEEERQYFGRSCAETLTQLIKYSDEGKGNSCLLEMAFKRDFERFMNATHFLRGKNGWDIGSNERRAFRYLERKIDFYRGQ